MEKYNDIKLSQEQLEKAKRDVKEAEEFMNNIQSVPTESGEEKRLKYFIEDKETGLWYKAVFQSRVHTFGQGWDKDEPQLSEYWTNDPQKAWDFKSEKNALEYISTQTELRNGYCKYMPFCKADLRTAKDLIVTEHQFVSTPPVQSCKTLTAEEIAHEILYMPVTNGQSEASIAKGIMLTKAYASQCAKQALEDAAQKVRVHSMNEKHAMLIGTKILETAIILP